MLTVIPRYNYQDTKFDRERRQKSICIDAKYMRKEVKDSVICWNGTGYGLNVVPPLPKNSYAKAQTPNMMASGVGPLRGNWV